MSRVIKQYPFNEMFQDTIECLASSIQDLSLPSITLQCFDFNNNVDDVVKFKGVARAEEDRKGVFLKLIELDSNDTLTNKETEEIVIDEEEFVDAIYNAINNHEPISDNEFIQKNIYRVACDYAASQLSRGRWFYHIEYTGFGVICSGQDIIDTIDTVIFEPNYVELRHCTSNIDLNNTVDCGVYFGVKDKFVKLTNFHLKNITGDGENLCNYYLDSYQGAVIDSDDVPVSKDVISGLTNYTPETEEEYIKSRLRLIDNDTEFNNMMSDLDDIL